MRRKKDRERHRERERERERESKYACMEQLCETRWDRLGVCLGVQIQGSSRSAYKIRQVFYMVTRIRSTFGYIYKGFKVKGFLGSQSL